MSNDNAVLSNEENKIIFKLIFLNSSLKIPGLNFFELKSEIIKGLIINKSILANIVNISVDYTTNELTVEFDERSHEYLEDEEEICIFIPDKYIMNKIHYNDHKKKYSIFEDGISANNLLAEISRSENTKSFKNQPSRTRSVSRSINSDNSQANRDKIRIPRGLKTEAKSKFDLTSKGVSKNTRKL